MGVKLEIFRMIIYLTFPVAMFWVSNQAEWFEDDVIQRKAQNLPGKMEGLLPCDPASHASQEVCV
uniref:Protein PET100 homolog, mitochondrial n=1 Tax=Homo sapiens TaxID=9606 RepID=A0A8V8TM65_HUMAN